jgi:AcrR family transcriptional regulator
MSLSEPIKEDIIQEQILLAAKQLFQVHGFRKVTMDDVAKSIGKGRSSLYYYYKSKEEILEAVIDIEIREMLTAMTKAVDKATTTEQKIHAFLLTKLKILRERRAFYNTIEISMDADEMSNYNKTKQDIHRLLMKQEGIILNGIIVNGVIKGELRNLSKKEQEAIIFVLLSTLRGLKREMVLDDDFSGVEVAADTLTNMVIHGLKR